MAKKFTQRETEQLIAGIREAYETKIRQLQYRLDGLVAENRSLRASLSEYKHKENRIGRAIVAAEEKGEEIRAFYRMSAETEWKTLQLFAEKWKSLAEQMAGLIPQGEAERYAEFADSLAALLGKSGHYFAPEQPRSEEEEASPEEEPFDPKAVIGKYMDGEEETGFNLDDVINPKGVLDLEKLCRSLGLMEDDAQTPPQAEEPSQTERENAQGAATPASQTAQRAPSAAQPASLTADRNASAAQPAVQQAIRIAAAAKPAAQSYLRPAMPAKPSKKPQNKQHGVNKFHPPR